MYRLDFENGIIEINGTVFILDEDNYDDKDVLLQLEYKEIQSVNFTITDFPDNLTIETSSENGFGTYLFHDLEICKYEGKLVLGFICRQPNKYWEGKYGLSTFLTTINDIVSDSQDISTYEIDVNDDWKVLHLHFKINKGFILNDLVKECGIILNEIISQAERVLSGVVWRQEYESDEGLFCTEILFPLLRKMNFVDVRYTHGVKEYGKDFTFSEPTKYGAFRHYGLQAKAGDVSGRVNAPIDEIIGQLNDAFSMSYTDVSAADKRFISTFIVAISGYFTDNAKDKIIEKIPNHFKGSVYFIDKDKTLELIEKFWK